MLRRVDEERIDRWCGWRFVSGLIDSRYSGRFRMRSFIFRGTMETAMRSARDDLVKGKTLRIAVALTHRYSFARHTS